MGNVIQRVESMKRTAADVFRQVANAKRRKFDSSSDKTLHDLPLDTLECILVKAIAMEVKDMKLSKSVWKEKADLVIDRMRSVCPYWSRILATNSFRDELHRTLDAQKTIGLKILHHSLIQCEVISVTTLKDEVLLFCLYLDQTKGSTREIRVYDRNNMAEVKEIIPFTRIRSACVAACNVSNCIYVLEQHRESMWCSSVFRFTRDKTHKWKIETWISDLDFSIFLMSVSPKGNLIIRDGTIKIYSPNGFLHRQITGLGYVDSVIERSDGKLVLASSDQHQTILTEIDTHGTIVRRYKSSLGGNSEVNFADISGRILINNPRNGIELLDSKFKVLEYTGPQPNQNGFNVLNSVHYNSERNEIASVYSTHDKPNSCALAIFRFSEE